MSDELIPLELIDDNPYQHRETYNDIDSLGRTIAINGLEQKPKARLVNGRYQLKEGHRRKRAFFWARENWQAENLPDRYEGYTVMPLDVVEATDRQMFDGMVIENIHRDDLKPTELAHLLKEYQEQFPDATSKDIGLVFGMNDATVRGMIRLPDLPEDWQEKLNTGVISQGVARTGLSMQKIVPAKAMTDILKMIEKEKGRKLPDDVIEDAVERLPNVVQMWEDDRRDGKPRSAWNNGWLLDMKNFPNKYLAEVDPGDVVEALQLDLDDPITLKFFAVFEKYQEANESDPEATYRNVALDGLDVPAEYIERVKVVINPPACTACPFYTRMRGTHFCGMKACYTRKMLAWKRSTIEQASKNLGIHIYDKTDGRYVTLVGWEDKHKHLVEKRDPSLRLIDRALIGNSYSYQGSFKGVEDGVFCVVATGSAIEKLGTKGGKGGGKKTEKEKAEMRAMKIFRARRREFLWEYTAAAQGIFENVPEPVVKEFIGWKFVGIDDRIPEEYHKHPNYQRRSLVWHMIVGSTSHYRRESLVNLLAKFEKLTEVKTPKELCKRAAEWDAEIDATAKVVSVETKKAKK